MTTQKHTPCGATIEVLGCGPSMNTMYRVYFSDDGNHALVEQFVPETATRRGRFRRAHWRVVRSHRPKGLGVNPVWESAVQKARKKCEGRS